MKEINFKDYRDLESKLSKFKNIGKPVTKSLFRGHNFITNHFYTVRLLKNGIEFEISYGSGFTSRFLIGVSLRHKDKDINKKLFDVQGCCTTIEEVEYILNQASNLII